nr:sulfite reductase flavoprotein subunit alpha [Novosphingobium flavum]
MKKLLFNLHWILGLVVGLFASIMAITGAGIAFDQDVSYWESGDPLHVEAAGRPSLSPEQIWVRARAANPDDTVTRLVFSGDPNEGVVVDLTGTNVSEGNQLVNQYTGQVHNFKYVRHALGKFGQYMEGVHRSLVFRIPGTRTGLYPMPKWAMFYTSLAVLILSLSGLYLRWPKSKLADWRSWFKINWKAQGYPFLYSLHAAGGTIVLIAFISMSHSGLLNEIQSNRYMDFVGSATGAEPARYINYDRDKSKELPNRSSYDLNKLWASFQREVPTYAQATVNFKESGPDYLKIEYLLSKQRTVKGGHSPALNSKVNVVVLDAHTGAVITHDRFGDLPLLQQIVMRNFDFHNGAILGLPGRIFFFLACLMMPVFFVTGWMMYLKRRRREKEAAAMKVAASGHVATLEGVPEWIVAYASQTGGAERFAWQTAAAFHASGLPAKVIGLDKLELDELENAERALFIVSTHGEGDPPDMARGFLRKIMGEKAALANLHFGVLALGDSAYANFCGFGRKLDAWLNEQGARPLFKRIDVDNLDAAALDEWKSELSHFARTDDMPDWKAPAFERWRLAGRRHLNPGSAGNPAYHIELEPLDGAAADWEAGDLAQILAPADPDRARDYSISSIPADGRVQLLVRQERRTDGTLGVGSGWLTDGAALGGEIAMRLHPHQNFRLGENVDRPLILIGNGTGLAGLRAHLKAKALAGKTGNWLIFGERNAAFDTYYADELEAWQAQGILERVDLVFSRDAVPVALLEAAGGADGETSPDAPPRRYVQDQLRLSGDAVCDWIARGAAIYVCGSLEGMATGVDDALVEILGADALDELTQHGRYRRDVY